MQKKRKENAKKQTKKRQKSDNLDLWNFELDLTGIDELTKNLEDGLKEIDFNIDLDFDFNELEWNIDEVLKDLKIDI